jgi:hypothetical protein
MRTVLETKLESRRCKAVPAAGGRLAHMAHFGGAGSRLVRRVCPKLRVATSLRTLAWLVVQGGGHRCEDLGEQPAVGRVLTV